ncbi:DUF7344 domain-containing protein [Halalkalirubrum salinum]|uniref:DUF7344 domain-containing protein n=1 Tax=Halalkalirubrum salinum TaxID=2563889 RepID=UPI0010FB470B|nr:hypothetical protein [Halalkalirubrum salinum]
MTAILSNWWRNNNTIPLSTEQAIEAIQARRRRHALVFLDDVDTSYPVGKLAKAIAAIENNKEISAVTSKERKRVYINLIQFSLPKLADIGAIRYDERGKQVYPTEITSDLADLIEHIESIAEVTDI